MQRLGDPQARIRQQRDQRPVSVPLKCLGAYLDQAAHIVIFGHPRESSWNSDGYAACGILRQQVRLDTPPEEGFEWAEIVVHADRLHRLAQIREVPLDTQWGHVPKVLDPQRRGEPLKGPSVPVYRAGRAVADATTEEKHLQGSLEVRFGVSICFSGPFWRGRIAETRVVIGLVETRGFEP